MISNGRWSFRRIPRKSGYRFYAQPCKKLLRIPNSWARQRNLRCLSITSLETISRGLSKRCSQSRRASRKNFSFWCPGKKSVEEKNEARKILITEEDFM